MTLLVDRDNPGRFAAVSAATAALLDVLLPPQCLACHEPVSDHGTLCPSCWTRIDFIEPPLCDKTGLPFAYDPGEGVFSGAALVRDTHYARLRAVARYGDVARALVHGLKYHDRLEGAPALARWMRRAGRVLIDDCDVILPVPLHGWRRWRRRYNQAALLVREIARNEPVRPLYGVLRRSRATRPQIGLNPRQRRRNVAGAFTLAPDAGECVATKRVLLVDDVLTTGATADACAAALKRGGARKIDVLVFARVVDAPSNPI